MAMTRKLIALLIGCILGTFSVINCNPRIRHRPDDIEDQKHRNDKRPNIILIVADDVGYNDVPWHNDNIYSPTLKHLAKTGIQLEQSYMLSTCSPSRAALLTGVYPFSSGMQGDVLQSTHPGGLPLKYPTMGNEFKRFGYATHAIGKWNQGFCNWSYTPTFRGFDTFFGFYQPVQHYYLHNSYVNQSEIEGRSGYDMRNNTEVVWEYYGQHNSIPFVKQAIHVMETHDRTKPFFMYFASPYCHIPHEVPRRFENQYFNSTVKNIFRRGFFARCSALDNDIKQIVKAFKKNGLYENSIIAFTSDNGANLHSGGSNFPLRGGKRTLYEGGTRVPGFIHSPNHIKEGFAYTGMMHGIDWLPTLLSAAGGAPETKIDGLDLWKSILNNKKSPRNEFFYDIVKRGEEFSAGVRKDNWKLIVGKSGVPRYWYTEEETKGDFVSSYFEFRPTEDDPTNNSTVQLFDLENDPFERNDLSGEHVEKVKELMAIIEKGQLEAVPVIVKDEDPAGDPALFGGVFTPGWCKAVIEPIK